MFFTYVSLENLISLQPTVLKKAQCLFNLLQLGIPKIQVSIEMTSDCIVSVLKLLDPKDPTHLEAYLLICIVSLGRTRGFVYSIYHYTMSVEVLMKEKTMMFLDHYKSDLDKPYSQIWKKRKIQDQNPLFCFALLAAAKFDIRTPILDRLSNFVPYLNDLMLGIAFLACNIPKDVLKINRELAKRIRTGNLAMKIGILILSNLDFRAKVVKRIKSPAFNIEFGVQAEKEAILALPELNNPKYEEQMLECLPAFEKTVEMIENSFIAIISNKQRLFINKNCLSHITASHQVFTKDFYRMASYPFHYNDETKYQLSLFDFYKYIQCQRMLNRIGMEFGIHLKSVLLDPKFDSVFSIETMGWGDVTFLISVYYKCRVYDKDIWDFLELVAAVDAENEEEDAHAHLQQSLPALLSHLRVFRHGWKVGRSDAEALRSCGCISRSSRG